MSKILARLRRVARPRRRLQTACPATPARPAAAVEPLESRQLLTAYYVSPHGSDANPGTRQQPWQTLERVSRFDFDGGDSIRLQGGQTFSGTLYLGPEDRGSRELPIEITSYGEGRARINGGFYGHGIFAYNTAGLEIYNLNVAGPLKRGVGRGILLYNDLPGDVLLDGIRIDRVDALRHYTGIAIGGNRGASGYKNVFITGTAVYNNRYAGLLTYAAEWAVHQKVWVHRVRAFDNTGIPFEKGTRPTDVSGHGIRLAQVNGAVVEYSTAYNNGTLGDGGAGIWTYDSNRVVFQFNESFANRTAGGRDGDGFDFDQNVSNSVMQYNYAHDNDGAGFLLSSHDDNALHTNTVVRYNVSQNDNRKMEYGALHAFGRITNSQWYNNTVYISNNEYRRPYAIQIRNGGVENQHVENLHIRNNSIHVTGGVRAVKVTSEQLDGARGIRFEGNNFFASDGVLKFQWGDETTYSSLGAWRAATGQERLNGRDVGSNVNPRHLRPAGAGAFGDPDLLPTMNAYALRSDSPLINRGLNLTGLFGLKPSGRDFLGNPVSPESADVGAFEYLG